MAAAPSFRLVFVHSKLTGRSALSRCVGQTRSSSRAYNRSPQKEIVMRQTSRFAASLAVLILFSCSQLALNSPTGTSDETAVLKAEHEWVDAALKGDVNAFSSL